MLGDVPRLFWGGVEKGGYMMINARPRDPPTPDPPL
jgi:hypothetical protein